MMVMTSMDLPVISIVPRPQATEQSTSGMHTQMLWKATQRKTTKMTNPMLTNNATSRCMTST